MYPSRLPQAIQVTDLRPGLPRAAAAAWLRGGDSLRLIVDIPQKPLDTDIFSHVLKAKDPAVVKRAVAYQEEFGPFTVSAVTVMEIVKGFQKVQRDDALERFLKGVAGIQVIPFDSGTATFAGRICGGLERTGQPIGRADPMIAATAIRQNMALATRKTTHFQRIQSLGYPIGLVDWRD